MQSSFKKFVTLREGTEKEGNNKDWRKKLPIIQLEKGFIPPPNMRPLIQAFHNSGKIVLQQDTSKHVNMPKKSLFLVGGAVRDFLRGKSPKDFDVATNATPEQIAHILHNGGFKVRGKGEKMEPDYDRSGKKGSPMKLTFEPKVAHAGENKVWYLKGRDSSKDAKPFVISAVVNGDEFEIATFRKDAKVTDGAAEVDFVDNPLEDAARRDLTINSLYIELTAPDGENKKLYDPTKQGWHDSTHGVVRTVGKSEERFNEDKLRVMRAVRFHSRFGKGFKMHPDIEKALPKFINLSGVSLERVREEFLKGLLHPDVDPKIYLSIYHRTGLMKKVFPEVTLRIDVPSQFRDRRDKALALAWILQNNPVDAVNQALSSQRRMGADTKQTGWSIQERNAVTYLLKLKQFDPQNVDELLNQKRATGLDAQQIKDWVDMFNIKDQKGTIRSSRPAWAKQVRTFADFEPDPREKVDWHEKIRCPNCRGKGCSECKNRGFVKGGIHPEIIGKGLANVDLGQRKHIVKSLNKERLGGAFQKLLEPEE